MTQKITVNVNDKVYFAYAPRVSQTAEPFVYVDYWSTRDGKQFGPGRWTKGTGKGAGAAIFAAVVEELGLDQVALDHMLANH